MTTSLRALSSAAIAIFSLGASALPDHAVPVGVPSRPLARPPDGVEIGMIYVTHDQAKASIRITWVRGLPRNEYRTARAESPIDATLTFGDGRSSETGRIAMPPALNELRSLRADCADVKAAYDLNPNDLSFRVLVGEKDQVGVLGFGLPDLRRLRALMREAGVDCG